MSKILVTGGAGFIGRHLVSALLQRRETVLNLDLLTYAGHPATIADFANHPQHHFVQGDIGDVDLVRKLLAEHQPRAILNLAAESHVDRSIDDGGPFVTTNVSGTFRLLEVARDYWQQLAEPARAAFRFIQVSTDEVYGPQAPGKRAQPNSPYAPSSYYSATKGAADHLVRAASRTYGLPTIVSHGTNTYGPYQYPEKLVPRMILNCLAGRALPLYGDGLQERDWIHVDDHVAGLLRVLEVGQPGETYHLGTGVERTNLEVVKKIGACVDDLRSAVVRDGAIVFPTDLSHEATWRLITHVADRPGHDRRYALDVGATERALSWKARADLDSELFSLVGWYAASSEWCQAVTQGRYDGGRLGLPRAPAR